MSELHTCTIEFFRLHQHPKIKYFISGIVDHGSAGQWMDWLHRTTDFYKKKNVRSLTKGEFDQLEYLKLCLLTGIEPFVELNPDVIKQLIDQSHKPSEAFIQEVGDEMENFVYLNTMKPTVDEMKYIYASVYVNLSAVEV